MVVAAARAAGAASDGFHHKEVVVQYGEECCKLLLVEGADSAALVFALNSRLGLAGRPFHLTAPGSDAVVPLTAALPGGLTLALHVPVLVQEVRPPCSASWQSAPSAPAPARPPPSQGQSLHQGPQAIEAQHYVPPALPAGALLAAALADVPTSPEQAAAAAKSHCEELAEPFMMVEEPWDREERPQERRRTWSGAEPGTASPGSQQQPDGLRPASLSHYPSQADLDMNTMAQAAVSTAEAAESIDRFGRLSTDLANERTLLAWLRTAMAAIRTTFAFLDITAGDKGLFWMSSVWLSRTCMITAIMVATLTGIRRYSCVKEVTYQLRPPQSFGRISVFWFNYLLVTCVMVMMAGMYMDAWIKN